jgi:DNA polymerase-1
MSLGVRTSNQTNLSRKESWFDWSLLSKLSKIKIIQEQIEFARENGYVQTILGRRRYLKDINSQNAMVRGGAERNAVNAYTRKCCWHY